MNKITDSLPMLLFETSTFVSKIEKIDRDWALAEQSKHENYNNIPPHCDPKELENEWAKIKGTWVNLSPKAQTLEDVRASLLVWSTLENLKIRVDALTKKLPPFIVIELNPRPAELPDMEMQLGRWIKTQTEIVFDQEGSQPLTHFLSNDYPCSFEVYNKTYKTASDAFHYLRGQRKDFDLIALMETILKCKFNQHSDLKKMLLATGALQLYFFDANPGKSYWGVDSKKNGQNILGILLIQLRTIL